MKNQIITKEKLHVDVADEIMSFVLRIGIALCAMIGFWAVSCLVAGLISAGPFNMARGYITAITGL